MEYWEQLPPQCPPATAADVALSGAFRIVFNNPPTKDDFKSKRALGHEMEPDGDECRFSSCSLFTCVRKVGNVAGLPKVRARNPFVASIDVPVGAGKSLTRKKHVDFWMYSTFDPVGAVVDVWGA